MQEDGGAPITYDNLLAGKTKVFLKSSFDGPKPPPQQGFGRFEDLVGIEWASEMHELSGSHIRK